MESLARRPVTASASEALAALRDGMTLAIGGHAGSNKPMALIREIVRQGRKNLTVVAPPSGIEVDLLVATGCVRRLITPYVGVEGLAPICPFYRAAIQNGSIEIREVDQGILSSMLRAARHGLPFLPWRGGVGTSLPQLNPDLKMIEDPFGGEKLLAVPALRPDVALLHVARGDAFGNAQHLGATFLDQLIAGASQHTIVEVDQLVPNEVIRSAPELTTVLTPFVQSVVVAPFGAHPLFSQRRYSLDRDHLREYLEAAYAAVGGNRAPFEQYLRRYIYEPTSHEEYLQVIGFPRILGLQL